MDYYLVNVSGDDKRSNSKFFVLKLVYQAKTLLVISKSPPVFVSRGITVEEFINLQTLTPVTFSAETYIGFLKNSSLEERAIDICNLRTGSGEKLSLIKKSSPRARVVVAIAVQFW